MNVSIFTKSLSEAAADFVSKLYSLPDLSRTNVQELLNAFTIFLQTEPFNMLLNEMIQKCVFLGDSSQSIQVYKGMFIPLRNVLKEIFKLPFIFNDSREYLQNLEENDVLIKNVVQSESWKKKKATLGEKLVFPIFMYQDDYETNNPLGSHKGLGKMGAVYIVMPCLPPHLSSKTENIFLLTLYKSNDLKYPNQIKTRFIKMSASESRCILENIGVLIGDWVPRKNLHWRLVILIKEIFDIVSATVIHKGISYYLTNLIGEYLHLLSILFPGSLKPKHHYMLHYATIMERKGPLWNMNCMRPESKNRDSKITSRITLNRTNISKTLAIKSQLILNHRLRNRLVSNKLYESNKSTLKSVPELQEYCSYAKLLSFSHGEKFL
ncbi:Protein of unknown function [Cotesia congregata]|uniref:Uncharacterized protein n=1 Tax=Cotesia congregata TaxID=51543 RepID=A0A8J2HC96_COTCN|nr:Protein of unknown function [Cotesia congregata]